VVVMVVVVLLLLLLLLPLVLVVGCWNGLAGQIRGDRWLSPH